MLKICIIEQQLRISMFIRIMNYPVQYANRTYFIRDRLEIMCNVPGVVKRLIVLIPNVYTTGDFFITIYVFVDNACIRFR